MHYQSYTITQFKKIPEINNQVPQVLAPSQHIPGKPKTTDNLNAYVCISTWLLNSKHKTTGIAHKQPERSSSFSSCPQSP